MDFIDHENPQQIFAVNEQLGIDEGNYVMWFTPSENDRIVLFFSPVPPDGHGFGQSLKAPENISKKELNKLLADPKWQEIAKDFITNGLLDDDTLTFRKKNRVYGLGFTGESLSVEVVAMRSDGRVHQVCIHPDNMKVWEYHLWKNKKEYTSGN